MGAEGMWQQDWEREPPVCERDIEKGRGGGVTLGARPLLLCLGLLTLKEFVVLLFFQKELQLDTCFHLIPEPPPPPGRAL